MEKFLNLKSKGKLVAGFSLIIAATVFTLILAYLNIEKIEKVTSQVLELDSLTFNVTNLRSDYNRIHAITLTLVIESDSANATMIVNDINSKKRQIIDEYKAIDKTLTKFPVIKSNFNNITNLISESNDLRDKYISTINANIQKDYTLTLELLDRHYNQIRENLISVETEIRAERDVLLKVNQNLRKKVINQSVLFGIILIIISVLIMVYIINMLKKISKEIKGGIEILSDSSQNILSTITEMSAGASETAASVSETTATVEEVRQTATVANHKAQSLLESTKRVKASADNGQRALSQIIEGMEKIDHQMKKISGTVLKLSEQNRRVGEITSSVADIADQSNLLAVNAAIEAAKAGEQGKGFTVVAREIRNLSDQSKRATEQVKEILHQIDKSVTDTVGVTEESKITVESGKELVMQSGEVMEMLASNIDETRDAAMQISSSNHQQMAGMDQIVPAMENIKKASEQNAEGIRQSQNATKELHSLGLSLKKILIRFNL